MPRLLLIVALALMSGACASAPQYHAVLIPPMSTTEPAIPRPPVGHVDADVVTDDVEVTWPPGMEPEATPRPPLAAPTPTTPTTEDLKNQVQNLLAQNNSLQNALDDRRPSKLERYARELAAKDVELKAAQSELLQQVAKLDQYARELATMNAELKNAQSLRDKALDDVIALREKIAIDEKKLERFQTHLQVSIFLLLVLTVFAFFFGWQRGKARAQDFASARITALEGEREKMHNRITALKETHGGALRLRDTLLANCEAHLAEKNKSIDALKDAIKGRDLYIIELREALKRKRARIQEIKRQRAGPLPETVDDDPLPETPPDDENSPEAVFGPLERDDG